MVSGYISPRTRTVSAIMVRPKLPKRMVESHTMLFSIGSRAIKSQTAPISNYLPHCTG